MNRRTLFLIFSLVVVVAILSFAAVLQSVQKSLQKGESVSTKAPTPTIDPALAPDTTLISSPSATLLKPGNQKIFDIVIDSGRNSLVTTQIEMGFEPEFIDVISVQPGTFFDTPTVLLNTIDRKTGRIVLALGTTTAQKGTGTLAQVTVIGKKPTISKGAATKLIFLPKTQALGNSNKNLSSLVKQSIDSQIVITNE